MNTIDPTHLRVDNSALRATARCTTEAATRYVLHRTAPGMRAELLAGSAVHGALDQWLSTGATLDGIGAAKGALLKVYAEAGENMAEVDERVRPENVWRVTEAWMRERHGLLPWVMTKDSLFESQITIPLLKDEEGEIEFVALVDGLVQSKADGFWYVLEHKTTKTINAYWMDQWTYAAQITGYIHAAQVSRQKQIAGAFVNAIEIQTAPKKPGMKCRSHGVTYAECGDQHRRSEIRVVSRNARQINQWAITAKVLARKFRDIAVMYPTLDAVRATAPQEGLFHKACDFCEFKDWCKLGRPANFLVTDVWEPLIVSETA